MDLKDFIKATCVQISEGIIAANEELKDKGAIVNPTGISTTPSHQNETVARVQAQDGNEAVKAAHWISFDVALHAEEVSEKGGGLKISIASIGAGADAKAKDTARSESRLRFRIPMIYPECDNKMHQIAFAQQPLSAQDYNPLDSLD